jgi:prepilin-type processing-associated H-X9-DG protein
MTGSDVTSTTNSGTGPCVLNCNNLQGDIYSFHPTGANVSFADGSVRFRRDSFSIVILVVLVSKDGGEVVPSMY